MSAVTAPSATGGRALPSRPLLLSLGGLVVLGIVMAVATPANDFAALPWIGRGLVGSLLLFGITGAAAAARLTPAPLQRIWPVLALPAGAVLGPLGLTALGFATIPLRASLWIVLAGGVAAWLRWGRGAAPRIDWRALVPWLGAAVLVFGIALIPAWRTGDTTIYGQNPDSHQVVGSAVLFQHVPPTHTDISQPVDVVPVSWRFRYPILYALAGASNLSHFDPIRVFPALSGLLVVIAALGFGAFAVCCLGLPLAAGAWVALPTALNELTLHMAWHPYYNQLWGLALLPWATLFGWYAVRERSLLAAAGFVLMGLMLGLAYPLAFAYPAMIALGMIWALGLPLRAVRRPRGRTAVGVVVLVALLAVPIAGAVVKAGRGIVLFVTPHAHLWGGDFFTFLGPNEFVGTGAGIVGALAVLAVAVLAAMRLVTRREGIVLGVVLAICLLVDVRLRLANSGGYQGNYMDFKHLGYVGAFVLTFAAAAVAWLVSRGRALAIVGIALAALWFVPAVHRIRHEAHQTIAQVTPDMFTLRDWSAKLPAGSSIRLDVPPSGTQLWAQYMLYRHPLEVAHPVLGTTYAHAPRGFRADYVLTLRIVPGTADRLWGVPPFADPVPVQKSPTFVLYRLHMPLPWWDYSTLAMVQPGTG